MKSDFTTHIHTPESFLSSSFNSAFSIQNSLVGLKQMTLWFNEDKSGIKIIRGDLMDEASEFSEAILYKTETSYLLVGEFTQITNLKKSGVDEFTFTPQICLTEIHHSAYTKKVKDRLDFASIAST